LPAPAAVDSTAVEARHAWAAIWVALATSSGCSLLLGDTPTQCSSASDCEGEGLICVDALCVSGGNASSSSTGTAASTTDPDPSTTSTTAVDTQTDTGSESSSTTGVMIPPGPWGCLGFDPPEQPDPQPGVMHTYAGRVIDTITQVAPPNLQGRVCDALDVECASPLVASLEFDDNGGYSFQVPSGFEGYLEFTSDTTVPQILWIPGEVVEDVPDEGVPLQLVSPGIRDSLLMSAGYTNDETRGLVLLVATDCEGNTAAGVRYELDTADAETVPFYLYGLLPELEAGETDSSGFGGFFNAPPGFSTMSAIHVESETELSSQRFLIRAAWISAVASGPASVL
jgi:hypothetical protein